MVTNMSTWRRRWAVQVPMELMHSPQRKRRAKHLSVGRYKDCVADAHNLQQEQGRRSFCAIVGSELERCCQTQAVRAGLRQLTDGRFPV